MMFSYLRLFTGDCSVTCLYRFLFPSRNGDDRQAWGGALSPKCRLAPPPPWNIGYLSRISGWIIVRHFQILIVSAFKIWFVLNAGLCARYIHFRIIINNDGKLYRGFAHEPSCRPDFRPSNPLGKWKFLEPPLLSPLSPHKKLRLSLNWPL